MRDSFHHERHPLSSKQAGDVIRVFEGPFGDAIILGFADNGNARCGRPYGYGSCVGTSGPSVLTGFETIIYTAVELAEFAVTGTQRIAR